MRLEKIIDRYRKQKGQSVMGNLETQTILGTRHRAKEKKPAKKKKKKKNPLNTGNQKMTNTDPTKENPRSSRSLGSSRLL
jgi:hypothetical protein